MRTPLELVADPTRQRILQLIWRDERSAGDIAAALPVTFGATSQHLGLLRDAGLVTVRRDGRQRFYRANADALGPIGKVLAETWASQLWKLKWLAEFEAPAGRRRRRK